MLCLVQRANKLTQKVRNYSQIIEMNAMRDYTQDNEN